MIAGMSSIAIAAVALSLLIVPGIRGVLGAGLAIVMLAIVVSDARQFIIPNQFTAAGFGLGAVHALLVGFDPPVSALAFAVFRGVILASVFFGIAIAYRWLRQREGIGWGDIKLAGVAGLWLDWMMLPIAVEIAALAAIAVYVLRQRVLSRPLRLGSRLPFGAFLAPSIWLCWLLEASLIVPN